MRVVLLVLTILTALAAWPPARDVAMACGDKALTVGRGLKYGRAYAAIHPATVMLFARSGAAPLAPQLDTQLKRAGHRVVVATDAPGMREILRSTPVDIVLASLADAPIVEEPAAAAASHPALVYVRAEGEFVPPVADPARVCRLKASDQPTRFLTEIDQVMKQRINDGRQMAHR